MFPVIDVSNWERLSMEQMGTKPKFWCQSEDGGEYLFKESRSHAGEHWSEKIAAEIAQWIGLSHASIELAVCNDKKGTISKNFLPLDKSCSLVHGNELLSKIDESYPKEAPNFSVVQHTLPRIIEALDEHHAQPPMTAIIPEGVTTGSDYFLGYLMLDALITNTDRHHQNWGITISSSETVGHDTEIAPTFDHASSLGRELTDRRRDDKYQAELRRNETVSPSRRDQTIVGYLESRKGRSRIYEAEAEANPLHPIDVFRIAFARYNTPSDAWINRLQSLDYSQVRQIVQKIPNNIMSEPARSFCLKLIELNYHAIISRGFQYE
ncbi:MAG: hypothetical protein HUJ26_21310 [Planctomycetaceae bacterium]|nr:hypothetical protein [Planctomycetaceae bacterium]